MRYLDEILLGDGLEYAKFQRRVVTIGDKRRVLYMPDDSMREVHARMVGLLEGAFAVRCPSATGGITGLSRKAHVLKHKRRQADGSVRLPTFLLKVDFKDAYNSVDPSFLREILLEACLEHEIRTSPLEIESVLRRYFLSDEGGIAMGGPAAPALFNWYCERRLDGFVRSFFPLEEGTYTRYFDDLLFSSNRRFGRDRRRKLYTICRKAGFRINERKTEFFDLRRQEPIICGMRVTREGVFYPTRAFIERLQALFYRALHHQDVPISVVDGLMGELRFIAADRRFKELLRSERKAMRLYQQLKRKEVRRKEVGNSMAI